MHKVIACVFGVYLVVVLEGGGRKLSQQRKHTHGRETWPSIGHVGENPWRLNKHNYFFIPSQGHWGYSLRSHKAELCLYLMLNFFSSPDFARHLTSCSLHNTVFLLHCKIFYFFQLTRLCSLSTLYSSGIFLFFSCQEYMPRELFNYRNNSKPYTN